MLTTKEQREDMIAAMDAAGPCLWFGLPPCPKCGTDHGNPNCDANQDHYLREMVAESQPPKETP